MLAVWGYRMVSNLMWSVYMTNPDWYLETYFMVDYMVKSRIGVLIIFLICQTMVIFIAMGCVGYRICLRLN